MFTVHAEFWDGKKDFKFYKIRAEPLSKFLFPCLVLGSIFKKIFAGAL